jgi:hypothetical protein
MPVLKVAATITSDLLQPPQLRKGFRETIESGDPLAAALARSRVLNHRAPGFH